MDMCPKCNIYSVVYDANILKKRCIRAKKCDWVEGDDYPMGAIIGKEPLPKPIIEPEEIISKESTYKPKQNEVYIIGGGNSIHEIDKSKLEGKDLIVVNKGIIDFPNPKYFITIDHSFLKKLGADKRKLKNTKATKIFIANFVPSYMVEKDGKITDTRFNLTYNLNTFDMIIKSHKLDGFGYEFNDFRHGGNSAYCALQLAIVLGYKEINLLGIDLVAEGQTHYHGGYGQALDKFRLKLDEYYLEYKQAILGLLALETDIQIYSCSSISRLNNILKYKDLT